LKPKSAAGSSAHRFPFQWAAPCSKLAHTLFAADAERDETLACFGRLIAVRLHAEPFQYSTPAGPFRLPTEPATQTLVLLNA
jgi:hypothetical protein